MSDPLISTEELAARLGAPDLIVVDATWFMPGSERSGRVEHEQAHIPGAVFFDIDALSDQASDLPHMLLTPQAFASEAGALGLRREATVVVYDQQGIFSAPRVWWTLRVMGFPDVRVLDGGLVKWRAELRALATGPTASVPTTLQPKFESALVRGLEDVRQALDEGLIQVVDARAAARFRGEAPEPRPGLASGHMPGALNLPFGQVLHADGTMRNAAALREAFKDAEVDLTRPIITSCGSGVTASILALALACLGLADAPVYDGSWTEWASRGDMPIATGG
jgi:thiosulfate/3-mercaptopyruvate sulfurtransferase